MLKQGEYADVLRAIGWTLDQRLAGSDVAAVEIAIRGAGIVVSWQTGDGERQRERYGREEVAQLRERARQLREEPAHGPPGEQAESLRTIGQYLDEQQIVLERLIKLPEGHRVVGVLDWHSMAEWYPRATIGEMSAKRRKLRGTGKRLSP
ncbi:MAG TPA: hypothetical protein VFC51_01665 [Chloroflexota bacterium]|nr:hypothetical protein [Chloroflexota bacterium]